MANDVPNLQNRKPPKIGDLRITSTSIERQKRSQNSAPVLVIIFGNSLVFSRNIITSIGFYRYCAPSASAPVVVKNQSPRRTPGCWSIFSNFLVLGHFQCVFAEKGARFRGKWGLGAPPPTPPAPRPRPPPLGGR